MPPCPLHDPPRRSNGLHLSSESTSHPPLSPDPPPPFPLTLQARITYLTDVAGVKREWMGVVVSKAPGVLSEREGEMRGKVEMLLGLVRPLGREGEGEGEGEVGEGEDESDYEGGEEEEEGEEEVVVGDERESRQRGCDGSVALQASGDDCVSAQWGKDEDENEEEVTPSLKRRADRGGEEHEGEGLDDASAFAAQQRLSLPGGEEPQARQRLADKESGAHGKESGRGRGSVIGKEPGQSYGQDSCEGERVAACETVSVSVMAAMLRTSDAAVEADEVLSGLRLPARALPQKKTARELLGTIIYNFPHIVGSLTLEQLRGKVGGNRWTGLGKLCGAGGVGMGWDGMGWDGM